MRGDKSSYVLDNLSELVPDFDPGEHRLGRMFVTTVDALFSDSTDAVALNIGVRLAKCCPREPCGLVFCPLAARPSKIRSLTKCLICLVTSHVNDYAFLQ